MPISVLSQTSVDFLRLMARDGVSLLDFEFEDLVVEHNLQLLDVEYRFDENVELAMPKGFTQETNADITNCLQMAKCLPDLDDIAGTDERLWVTLGLRDYKEYAIARWPLKGKNDDPAKHLTNHWFAKGTRPLMRDHAISRLWWYHRLSSRIKGKSVEATLELIMFNSDYRSSMLERNQTSAITEVVSCVIEITDEFKSKGIIFQRKNFRNFMKEVDMIAGRSHLAALSRDQLHKKLSELYLEFMG